MIYTKEQIDRINSLRVAEPDVKYNQDNGVVWIGTYSKKLIIYTGTPALPVNASEETTSKSIDTELNTQTALLTSFNSKDFATSAKQDLEITQLTLLNTNTLGNRNKISTLNSTTTLLNTGVTFTGIGEDVSIYNSVVVAAKTDQDGTLYIEFSPDNINWDSSLVFTNYASSNEVHRITVTRKYCRIKFTNTSASNQTYLRLQTLFGSQQVLTSALNSQIQTDQDTIAVRPLDFNLMVAENLYQNRAQFIKDGINFDIDLASVPQDITNEGGIYGGFPRGAVEAGEIVVAGADTGIVVYSYLASATDTNYTTVTKAITGAGTYALGHNIWRCNFAYFYSTSASAFNVGLITIRNTVSIANIFCVIPVGYSQTYCAAYTVPYNSSIYIDRFNGNMKGSASGSLDGFIWYRAIGESPRLRFPFELQFGSLYFDDVDYLIRIPSGVDFIPRIITSSTNNLSAKFSYRLIKVKE